MKIGFILPLDKDGDKQIRLDCLLTISGFLCCLKNHPADGLIDCIYEDELPFAPNKKDVAAVVDDLRRRNVSAIVTFGDEIGKITNELLIQSGDNDSLWKVPVLNIAYSLEYNDNPNLVAIRLWPSARLLSCFIVQATKLMRERKVICKEDILPANQKEQSLYTDRYRDSLLSAGYVEFANDKSNASTLSALVGYGADFYEKLELGLKEDKKIIVTENFLHHEDISEGVCIYPGVHPIGQVLNVRSFDCANEPFENHFSDLLAQFFSIKNWENDVKFDQLLNEETERYGVKWPSPICKYLGYASCEMLLRAKDALVSLDSASLWEYFKKSRYFTTILGPVIVEHPGETAFPISLNVYESGSEREEILPEMQRQYEAGYLLEKADEIFPEITSTSVSEKFDDGKFLGYVGNILHEIKDFSGYESATLLAGINKDDFMPVYPKGEQGELIGAVIHFMKQLPTASFEEVIQLDSNGGDFENNDTLRLYSNKDKTIVTPTMDGITGVDRLCFAKNLEQVKWRRHRIDLAKQAVSAYKKIPFFDGYVYIIPALGSSRDYKVSKNVSVLILHCKDKLPYLAIHVLLSIVTRLFAQIFALLYAAKLQVANTKSAIGSIMSRNGSHNIGSHVLAALSHNVGTMPDDQVLYQYIQHRMDYIATATTERPTWSQPTMFVGDMMRRFLSQRHLLNYISRSEGLKAWEFQSDRARSEDGGGRIKIHIRKLDAGGRVRQDFIDYEKPDDTIKLGEDVSLAVPGGVVGQHAFFTIIENIIRNAAKHDWSTPPARTAVLKESRKKGVTLMGDLDVYIDFVDKLEDEDVHFKIWTRLSDVCDGVSNSVVVAAVNEHCDKDNNQVLNARQEARNYFKEIVEGWMAAYEQAREPLSRTDEMLLSDYLAAKSDNLPEFYAPIYSALLKIESGNKHIWEFLKDQLSGTTNKIEEFGHRIWMPLHHRQQLKLARPFIDESGMLRHENWGLAEMKISAGYLQKAETEDIGGINNDGGYNIIKPCSVQDSLVQEELTSSTNASEEEKKGCGELRNVYHLGYEFDIPRAKLILLLVGNEPRGLTDELEFELRRNGIYVMQIGEVSSKKELCYQYVVMDDFAGEKLKWMLPFRVIATQSRDKAVEDKVPLFSEKNNMPRRTVCEYLECVISVSNGEGRKICETITKDICVCWSRHLIAERRKQTDVARTEFIDSNEKESRIESKDDLIGNKPLSLVVSTVGGGSGAGETLVTDLDIVEYAFNEGIDGALEGFLMTGKNVDQARKFVEYLQSLKTFKVQEAGVQKDVNKLIFDKKRELNLIKSRTGERDFSCKAIVKRQLCAWLKLCNASNDIDDAIDYLNGESKKILEIEARIAARKRDRDVFDKGTDSWKEINYEIIDLNIDLEDARNSCENPIGTLVDYLVSYCAQVKSLISKYAETIATLPQGFSRKGNEELVESSQKDGKPSYEFYEGWPSVGIVTFSDAMLDQGEVTNSPEIDTFVLRYWRHQTRRRKSDKYLEGLSGTQSYLSTLENLRALDDSKKCTSVTRLVENALLRILIVDERTREFLEKHEALKSIYMNMGIYVANDKKISEELDLIETGKGELVKESPYLMTDGFVNLSANVIDKVRRNYPDEEDKDKARDNAIKVAREKFHEQFEVLVIHQGIIDKWLPGASHDKEKVERFIYSLKRVFRYVVITTGRGTPANIPSSARVLPFSTIQTTLFRQYPEKMMLTDAIMNMLPVKGV